MRVCVCVIFIIFKWIDIIYEVNIDLCDEIIELHWYLCSNNSSNGSNGSNNSSNNSSIDAKFR